MAGIPPQKGRKNRPQLDYKDVEHLEVDKAFIELTSKNPVSAKQRVINVINSIHRKTNSDRKKFTTGSDYICENITDKSTRYVSSEVTVREDGKKPWKFQGHYIKFKTAPLPETVISSAVGHKIGELVDLHPSVNSRIIRKLENTPSGITISTDMDLVPMPETSSRK